MKNATYDYVQILQNNAFNNVSIMKIPFLECSERLQLLDDCGQFLEARAQLLILPGGF